MEPEEKLSVAADPATGIPPPIDELFVIAPPLPTVTRVVPIPDVLRIPLTSTSVPSICPRWLAVVRKFSVRLVPADVSCNVASASITRLLASVGPLIDNVLAAAPVNVILLLLVTVNDRMVCVGTAVTFSVVPLLNTIISVAAGVVRVGDQFVDTAQLAPVAPIHAYVVCA